MIIKYVLLVDGLKHNLLSISKLCNKGYKITFEPDLCLIAYSKTNETVLVGKRVNNVYMLNVSCITSFKQLNVVSTSRPLEMLHMHLFGPSRTMSLGGNDYGLV